MYRQKFLPDAPQNVGERGDVQFLRCDSGLSLDLLQMLAQRNAVDLSV